jgi:hypothetical protein
MPGEYRYAPRRSFGDVIEGLLIAAVGTDVKGLIRNFVIWGITSVGRVNVSPAVWLNVVDSNPATSKMGIVVFNDGQGQVLRRATAATSSNVVFQIQSGDVGSTSTRLASGESNGRFWAELWGMGVSCGGAVVSGVGVVGAVALGPETGGLSLPAAVLLWGGAAASAAQCGVSTYRLGNVVTGREKTNDELDQDARYKTVMYVLDGIGLVGAGGAIKEVAATNAVLKEAGITWEAAKAGNLSRPARRILTEGLELQGAKRVPAAQISRVVKKKLLDLTGAAVGMTGSATTDGSVVHDIGIWVVTKPASAKP